MKLKSLTLQGFRSFQKKQTLDLDREPGLYLIRGENLAEPHLGANGVGKSTLGDSICWALYGKTARGLSAGSVETWFKGPRTEVTLEVEDGTGQTRTIERSRKPIRLTLDGDEVRQDQIDDLVGVSYEVFLQTYLCGQFGTLFTDQKATARLDLFTEILGLGQWVECAGAAKRIEAAAVDHQNRLTADIARVEGRIAAKKEELELATSSVDPNVVANAKKKVAIYNKAEKSLRIEESEISASIDTIVSALSAHQKKTDKAVAAWEVTKEDVLECKTDIDKTKRSMKTLRRSVDDLKALVGVCPTCGQKVAQSAVQAAIDQIEVQIQDKSDAQAEFERELEYLQGLEEKEGIPIKDLDKKRQSILTSLDQHKEDLKSVRDDLQENDSRLRQAEFVLKTEQKALDSHEENIKKLKDSLKESKVRKKELTQEQAELAQKAADAGFWKTGFKDLRLWLVDKALAQLTIQVNSALVELGLREWSIEFLLERETASKTISRGFEIYVKSPYNKKAVIWESWSGGESQRLRVACATGLGNLVRDSHENLSNVEIWDEPTQHLDSEGVFMLVEFMQQRAKDNKRPVYIIDHRSLESGEFEDTISITKTDQGSEFK